MANDIALNIIFLLIFTCPGFMIHKALKLINETTKAEPSDYDKSVWAFLYSFIVLLLNFMGLMLYGKNIDAVSAVIGSLDSFQFLVKYILLTLANTGLAAFFIWLIRDVILFNVKSLVLKTKLNVNLWRYPTVWETILNGKSVLLPDLRDMCIEIIKDGKVITQGSVQTFPDPESGRKDILISDVVAIRAYLDNDKETEDEYKMFPKVLAEYYDMELDILIRVYDNAKWVQQFGEHKA